MNENRLNADCWIEVYEHSDFNGRGKRIYGPCDLTNLKKGSVEPDFDWGDQIDSVIVGPGAWVWTYEDEDFGDDMLPLFPRQSVHRLDELNFGDEIDSMRIFSSNPYGKSGKKMRTERQGPPKKVVNRGK